MAVNGLAVSLSARQVLSQKGATSIVDFEFEYDQLLKLSENLKAQLGHWLLPSGRHF